MASKDMPQEKGRVFYGWFALAGVMLVIFTMSGAFVNSFSVFLPVISDDFGWSRAAVAAALSIGIISFGLPSPIFGYFVARFGARFALIVGNAVGALAIASLGLMQELWQFYGLYVLAGLGGGFGGYIACSTVVNNWFIRKRSLALGLFTACGSLGGFIFPPIVTAMIESIGWQITWASLGGMVMVLGVVTGGVVLARNRPEDMGQFPDGVPPSVFVEKKLEESIPEKTEGRNMKRIVREPAVWLIALFSAANAFTLGTISTHQVAYVQDIGYAAMTAATTMSVMHALSVIGSVVFGALALRLNIRFLAVAGFAFQLAALLVLLSTQELGLIYVYAVLIGVGNGALMTALPTFIGAYFGRERYAQVLGIVLPFQVVSQGISATVAGAIYDTAGNYIPAFIVAIGCSVLGIIAVFLARRPKAVSYEG